MPVAPHDRPIEALREETVDQLIMNYGHGKLSRVAFERRLDDALDADTHDKLVELTRDLDLHTDKQYDAQKRAELGEQAAPPGGSGSPSHDVEHMINVFSGSKRSGVWDVPREIWMINIFGGAKIDFSNARFSARTTHIKMICIFGGVKLYVRDNMRAVSKAVCIFGGVHNRGPSTIAPDAPTLVINGIALFGGADIRVRKTARERLYEFADSLRAMFDTARPPRA